MTEKTREKEMSADFLFSVVTVCWNEAGSICRTVESVVSQQSTDFEYLLVDGASADDTVSLACRTVNGHGFPSHRFRCVSQPDKGVYDAMNHAASMARGRYVIYMNAGDGFFDSLSLSHYTQAVRLHPDADVLYGSTLYVDGTWQRVVPPQPLSFFNRCTPFCHQASATRRDLLLAQPFRIEFRIVADYDFFLRQYHAGARFVCVPHTLARFVMGGISNNNVLRAQHEVNHVARADQLVGACGFYLREAKTYVRQFVRFLTPAVLLRWRKKRLVSSRTGWQPTTNQEEL